MKNHWIVLPTVIIIIGFIVYATVINMGRLYPASEALFTIGWFGMIVIILGFTGMILGIFHVRL